MLTLKLLPAQDSYEIRDLDATLSTALDGGRPRVRRTALHNTLEVKVVYEVSSEQYQYLRSFYNLTNKGTDIFLAELLIDTLERQLYAVQIMPGTWKMGSIKGLNARVSMTLLVQGNEDGIDHTAIVQGYTPETYTPPPPPADFGLE